MFGLIVMAFLVLYLTVSIGVIALVFRWAKNRGRRAWLWGGVAAFVMYNLVFLDYLPTLITYEYLVIPNRRFGSIKLLNCGRKRIPGLQRHWLESRFQKQYKKKMEHLFSY